MMIIVGICWLFCLQFERFGTIEKIGGPYHIEG
jgi:hypothetical protein